MIIRDAIKSLPYITGSRMHCVWPGYPSITSSTNYVSQLDYTDQHFVFWKTKADRQVEAVIMEDKRVVVFSDYGGKINAQMISGQTSGQDLLAFTNATAGGVYCVWQIEGESLSTPVLISMPNMLGDMPDFIIDVQPSGFPDAYLHFVWCERADELDNWEVFYRKGHMEYS